MTKAEQASTGLDRRELESLAQFFKDGFLKHLGDPNLILKITGIAIGTVGREEREREVDGAMAAICTALHDKPIYESTLALAVSLNAALRYLSVIESGSES